jgi:N-methylhydantoinase B
LSDGSQPDPKIQQTLDPAIEVHMKLPGGGGFWSPLERKLDDVMRDVVEGKVSIAAAEQDYGVVIVCRTPPEDLIGLPGDYEIDRPATAALRERLAGKRDSVLTGAP